LRDSCVSKYPILNDARGQSWVNNNKKRLEDKKKTSYYVNILWLVRRWTLKVRALLDFFLKIILIINSKIRFKINLWFLRQLPQNIKG